MIEADYTPLNRISNERVAMYRAALEIAEELGIDEKGSFLNAVARCWLMDMEPMMTLRTKPES